MFLVNNNDKQYTVLHIQWQITVWLTLCYCPPHHIWLLVLKLTPLENWRSPEWEASSGFILSSPLVLAQSERADRWLAVARQRWLLCRYCRVSNIFLCLCCSQCLGKPGNRNVADCRRRWTSFPGYFYPVGGERSSADCSSGWRHSHARSRDVGLSAVYSWRPLVSISVVSRKAHQRLFGLRLLRNVGVSSPVLELVHRSLMDSLCVLCIRYSIGF